MEYIKEDHERTKMQLLIVNAFLSSPVVTELNKNNLIVRILIDLVGKITDNKIKEDYTNKVKAKQVSQKDSTLEYYLTDMKDKNRFSTAWQ
jgi:hypothetical protein